MNVLSILVAMNVLSGFCGSLKKLCPSRYMGCKGFSMHAAKRIVDRAPPCGMPCVVGNSTDVVVPNLTDSWVSDIKYCSIVYDDDGMIGCRMSKRRVLSTVSKAFVRSIPHKWTTLVYLSTKAS